MLHERVSVFPSLQHSGVASWTASSCRRCWTSYTRLVAPLQLVRTYARLFFALLRSITYMVIACGYMLGATSEDGLSHTLRTSDKCADADCESLPTLLCRHTATQLPQVQQMLLDYPSCGYMPVSHALPVWGGCQQPLQIASRDRLCESFATATMFCVVISVW